MIVSAQAPAWATPSLVPSPCPAPAAAGEPIECFTLTVPENRAKPEGKTISLPVVRFRSRSKKPAEPIMFLVGGPGGSAIRDRLSGAHNPFVDDHDWILFPQRGTRFSTPTLNCPGYEAANEVIFRKNLGGAAAIALQRDAAAECARQLRAQGIDLDGYDTADIVADLFDLQRTLKIPAFSIYATSYGTRVALEAMRGGSSAIHSVVLDSVLPPDVRYDEMATDNVLAALDRVLDQCAADPACDKAFPDLRSRWNAALIRSNHKPFRVSMKPAKDAVAISMRLTGRNLIDAVYDLLNSRAAIPTLPQLLDSVARGKVDRIVETLVENAGPARFARGQRLSVWCRDEAPVTDARIVAAQSNRHPELDGWSTVAFDPAVCKAWPVTPSAALRTPVVSDVPTLILAGEYDPNTPPAWGRRVLATLKNGYFVEIPGMSHLAGDGPCGTSIALAFLRDPKRLPDTTCAARVPAPAFTLPQ